MTDQQDVSRRDFLRRLGALGVVGIGTPSLIVACDSSGGNERKIAQTFQVTVGKIDPSYPWSDQNDFGTAYAMDGDVGSVLTLQRGKRYEFALQDSVAEGPNGGVHPFYIGTTAEGQGGDEFSQGVENAKSTSGSVFFEVPDSAPNTLYYQCSNHVYMGGEIEVIDGQGGGNSDDGSY
ncbi:MAG: twin-arginine translocation signal domain-containing protein [Salinibacter sp.]